jgi:hypothetical protein
MQIIDDRDIMGELLRSENYYFSGSTITKVEQGKYENSDGSLEIYPIGDGLEWVEFTNLT